MSVNAHHPAIATVPPGPWAVGVSGGADSVALLLLLHRRPDLKLHVAHLDHQTRGEASTGDAEFVGKLAERLNLPCTIALRSDIETGMQNIDPNSSSRYRTARHALFRQVIAEHALAGVILAHHADDQAETVLQRLLRGSGANGLAGMDRETNLGGLRIVRPLLNVRRAELRAVLQEFAQDWREDASNASDDYFRNRLRRMLSDEEPELTEYLMDLGRACAELRDWVRAAAPELRQEFRTEDLERLPRILAEESARQWLIARNVPIKELVPGVIERLLAMASDAATPPRVSFPGNVLVSRRKGNIRVIVD